MTRSNTTTPAPKRRYKRLTPATWAEIRAFWEVGETTLAELADRHGVSTRALQSHFAKHGAVKGAKAAALASAVEAKVLEQELPDVDLLVERAKSTRERAYQNATVIEDLVMAQLSQAQKSPEAGFKAAGALKALNLAAGTLERLYGLKSAAIGLDKNPDQGRELPELAFCGFTDAEIADLQREDDPGYDLNNEVVGEENEIVELT